MKFLSRPRGEVLAKWRRTIAYAYAPERLFARFRYPLMRPMQTVAITKGKLTEGQSEARRWRSPGISGGSG